MNTVNALTEQVVPGGSFENATYFPNVNITFAEFGATFAGTTLTLTTPEGDKEIGINSSFYTNKWGKDVIVKIGNEMFKKSGTYTLHVPAGFITLNGESNEAMDLTWTYTNSNDVVGGDEKELTLKSFTVGEVDMLGENPAIELLTSGVPVKVAIDPIPEAQMIAVQFADRKGNLVRKMEIYNMPSNPSIEVDPTAGTYNSVVFGKTVNKFFNDTEYTATLTAYNTTNAASAGKKWGPVVVNFTGTSIPYKYSPYTVVSVSPEDGTEVVDFTQPIVIEYSGPVKEVTCKATEGGQGAQVVSITDMSHSADYTIWTIKPGRAFWQSSKQDWTFMIAAKDESGLVVKGTNGNEATSYYSLNLPCYLSNELVEVKPASGIVEELYEFYIEDKRGVSLSYSPVPYLLDEDGKKIYVDVDSQKQYDAQGRDISTLPLSDVKAVKAVFNLKEKVTKPGKYTFVAPTSSFNVGQESSLLNSRYVAVDYKVVVMPKHKVNVELVNFGKTSFDVNEGRDVTVALNPAADWKLSTLTLNDKDVTADVAENAYTLTKVAAESNLVATFEYAQEIDMIETTGIVNVADRECTITNTAEGIKIENLQAGDNVKVYTANGMSIGQFKATKDVMTISVPAGQVYVVKINDAAVKVKH